MIYGNTPTAVIPETEALVGNVIKRIFADKSYLGHNLQVHGVHVRTEATNDLADQARTAPSSVVLSVIGYLKSEYRRGPKLLRATPSEIDVLHERRR